MSNKSLEQLTSTPSNHNPGLPVEFLIRLLQNWRWFVVSMTISLIAGFLILRYSTPGYEINASILVKDDTKGTDFGESAVLESLGLTPGKSNVDNEVEILKSRTLMESVVTDLQLYVKYFATGRVKTTEIYEKSPVLLKYVNPQSASATKRPIIYFLTFKDNNHFTITDNTNTWRQAFGDTFSLPDGLVILNKTAFKPNDEDQYSIEISGKDHVVNHYRQNLSVSATNKLVSIIDVKLTEILPIKGEVIVKKLIENYLKASIADKNRIADSTIAFIDQNLKLVSQQLTGIEKEIETFRIKNHLTDIKEQSRLLLENASQFEKEQMSAQVQLAMTNSLLSFIQKNPAGIIPSSIVMQQPDFLNAIDKYNSLLLLRDKTLLTLTSDHPSVKNLNAQLGRIREDLIEKINSKNREIELSNNSLNKSSTAFRAKTDQLPAKERVFLDFARNQEIKQELYIFLLKKRVETSISKSSTLANGRVIDNAKADHLPISPNRQLTFAVVILLGLSFPIGFFYLKDLLNTRVTEKSEVINSINMPLIAEIGHNDNPQFHFSGQNNHGYLSEQFRALRTNLQFLSALKKDQVILVTSSMGGEGKTFIALNLCFTLQLTGKKVVLIEFDLRKPKIGKYLQLKGKGLTHYILDDIPMEDVIQSSGISPLFDVVTAGMIPPNPAELIMASKIEALISKLKERYDYIIFDTAPVGLVTDARILSPYANISLYIVRQNFTYKNQLEAIANLSKNKLLPKLHLVLNDVKTRQGYGYGYNNY